MKIPCKNCVCLAVCRHKTYFQLSRCDLLQQFIESYNRDREYSMKYRRDILKYLKPTRWKVNKHGYFIDKNGNEVTQRIRKPL